MTQKRVSVRIPGEIARALDNYCCDNYLDRSTVMRTALLKWEPLQKYLEEAKRIIEERP